MQRLEVSGAVRPLYGLLGVKGLRKCSSYAERGSLNHIRLHVQYGLPMIDIRYSKYI